MMSQASRPRLFQNSQQHVMELTWAAPSPSHRNLPTPVSCSSSLLPFLFYSSPSSKSFNFQCSNSFPLQVLRSERRGPRTTLQPLLAASESDTPQSSEDDKVRWLLVPVGDGDSKHLGYKVEMPDAFEIVSDKVTVGRLPDKADIVIPVATVSGVHARIQKQEEKLLITDLDSTNGTFIDEKRLRPGVVAAVSSGSCVTFGDIHLAMFQVSKLKTGGSKLKESESVDKQPSDDPTIN